MPRVLHVTPQLSRGGAGRALLNLATTVTGVEHRVLSLTAAAEPAAALARASGIELVDSPADAVVLREIENAEIVQVHFWNTPELYELLSGGLPEARVVVWAHVAGDHAPHVLTRGLLELALLTVATSPYTADLATTAGIPVIPPAAGWARLEGIEPRAHHGFNVGYVGTVDFTKMHPDYVAMSARVGVPEARFVVCGSGAAFPAIARQAEQLGMRERFDLRGYASEVGSVLAELDVFGYPLRPDNYAAGELVLQEAMYARVPPVVLAGGAEERMVEHGRTGLVAADEDEYVAAIERLHARPEERTRLGAAARDHAIRAWSPEVAAERWSGVYGELLGQPKRVQSWRSRPAPGAALFIETLGDHAAHFRTSLLGGDPDRVLAAERAIAASPPGLTSADTGGVLHYRARYPDDVHLRLWSGLILAAHGRHALAAGEFSGALARGFEHWRASMYLAESARALGQPELAEQAERRVPEQYAGAPVPE